MKKFVFILILTLCFPAYLQAQIEIEEALHASIILKALSYDSKMESANVLVVSRKNGNSNRSILVKSINGKSIKSNPIVVTQLTYGDQSNFMQTIELSKTDIVYLCDDLTKTQLTEVSSICDSKKILTITGVPDFVKSGHVSISVVDENQKPKIIINLKKVKSEGRSFSASLLKLCKIIE